MRFAYCMVPEVYQLFWAAMARGEFITDAAVEAGTYRKQGTRWLAAAGGVRPRRGRGLKGRRLTLAQREEIALGRAPGQSVRSIAAAIRRSPSTVSRELRRNADRLGGYRATTAHALAYARASRPKRAKLVTNLVLLGKVEADLAKKYSPEQISGRLKLDFPDQPEMQVSTANGSDSARGTAYEVEPDGEGTLLTESHEVTRPVGRIGWLVIEQLFGARDPSSDLRGIANPSTRSRRGQRPSTGTRSVDDHGVIHLRGPTL